jgi:ketosteroid isomerase-like protein
MHPATGWILTATVLVMGLGAAQDAIHRDLNAMADTEREFAKTATVKGWRDAFLDFFADDAIAVGREVTKAKDGLRKQPPVPFSEFELVWEPRTGDVAASGDLGWLTGPSTSINHAQGTKPGYGCYLSIWRKQPDGRWRVFIDVGASAPAPVPFAPGFTQIAFGARYAGKDGKETAGKSLAEADREFNGRIAAEGSARAFGGRVTASSRLHRPGFIPIVGTDSIAAWLAENASRATATGGAAEAAAAGDVGYSYGTFETSAPNPQSGAYVRLWSRDAAGRWWLMVDVAQPFRP